jgi:hypothetical protein
MLKKLTDIFQADATRTSVDKVMCGGELTMESWKIPLAMFGEVYR